MRVSAVWLGVLAASLPIAVLAIPAAHAEGTCRGELVYFASLASGPGSGIVAARLDPRSGVLCRIGLAAKIDKPTWVVAGPGHTLYSTSENNDLAGPSVFAYRADASTGALRLLDSTPSGGAGAAFLSIDRRSRTVFAAHWNSGHVSALPVLATGALGSPAAVEAQEGTGPTSIQMRSRSHAIVPDPRGRFVLATNFAGDRIAIYRFDARARRLLPHQPAVEQVTPGSGPRHLVFHPSGRFLYLINQLTSTINSYAWDGRTGTLRLLGASSTIAQGFRGQNDAAGLIVSRDGRSLYASNRGEDTIVAYAIDRTSGLPAEQQRIASGGSTPRAITLDPTGRWLLVANQGSDQAAVFARDPKTGLLTPTTSRLQLRQPAGATFVGP